VRHFYRFFPFAGADQAVEGRTGQPELMKGHWKLRKLGESETAPLKIAVYGFRLEILLPHWIAR
jgi:hypothetical protein